MTLLCEQTGIRLDRYLVEQVNITRSAAQRLIEDGQVVLNGSIPKKNTVLKEGDQIEVTLLELVEEVDIIPQDIPLDIVLEDDDLIVLNKPVGMVVHPSAGHPDGTLVNALLHHCGAGLSGINGARRPGIVHRIDKDTGGLLIVAKNDFAHQSLAAQLVDHSLQREYAAIVVARFREDEGTVNAPIGRSRTDRKKMAIDPQGRTAITHWQVVARYNSYTHIACRLETGRTHQIRVHMTSIGHPLVGDRTYGGGKLATFGLPGQCLFARRLTFSHPRSGEEITVECPLPDWFLSVIARLGNTID